MIIDNAKIELHWSGGQTTTIGTIDLTSTDDEAGHVNCRVNTKRMRQSLGWCLVRMGFRMMFPGRMWKEGYHA